MNEIIIRLDFLSGPIWPKYFDASTKKDFSGSSIVDNDPIISMLDKEIRELYSSYYHMNVGDSPCVFDHEQEKKDKSKMLELFKRLNDRLTEINDGSFSVKDEETPRIKSL